MTRDEMIAELTGDAVGCSCGYCCDVAALPTWILNWVSQLHRRFGLENAFLVLLIAIVACVLVLGVT